jgi:hypothetical protein
VPGSYQDLDGDGLVSWQPDPNMPNEKPPAGQDKSKVEDAKYDKAADKPADKPLEFAPEGKPYSSVSTVGEAVAEFTTAFTNMFGANAPKALTTAFTNELQALQMSRSTKRAGKNENIIYQGVSPQERANILNKYLTTHAKNITGAAKLGDVKAKAALQKGNF